MANTTKGCGVAIPKLSFVCIPGQKLRIHAAKLFKETKNNMLTELIKMILQQMKKI